MGHLAPKEQSRTAARESTRRLARIDAGAPDLALDLLGGSVHQVGRYVGRCPGADLRSLSPVIRLRKEQPRWCKAGTGGCTLDLLQTREGDSRRPANQDTRFGRRTSKSLDEPLLCSCVTDAGHHSASHSNVMGS
jgi:hypothetical protein